MPKLWPKTMNAKKTPAAASEGSKTRKRPRKRNPDRPNAKELPSTTISYPKKSRPTSPTPARSSPSLALLVIKSPKNATLVLPDAHNAALVYLAHLRPSGQRAMASRLKLMGRLIGQEDITRIAWAQMRYAHVVEIRTKLTEKDLSPASINAALCALRGTALTAWRLGQMTAEEYERIRSVKAVSGSRLPAGRALEQEEVAALLAACAQDDSAAGPRDAAILAVIFGGGLRRSEVAALKVEDFDARKGSLRVMGKGNKERLVYLATGATQAISDWLIVRGKQEGALFCPVRKNGNVARQAMTAQAIYNALAKRSTLAGVASCSPHDGRRTFISELLDAGADLSAVQQLVGHANIQTTARYDRRGEKAKKRAASLISLPYRVRRTG